MKPSFIAMAFIAGTILAHAEFKNNPDSNTLWIEDGKDIAVEENAFHGKWSNNNLSFAPLPTGGFSLETVAGKKNNTLHYVPCKPEYPWLTWEITEAVKKKGYTGFTMGISQKGGRGFNQVSHLTTGIFSHKPLASMPNGVRGLTLYLYGAKLHFKYLKAVKEPANYVFAESDAFARKHLALGDRVKFTVKLAKPCEDVTIRLFNPYMMQAMSFNKQDKLQLKPINDEARIWTADITITDFKGSVAKHDNILMKAVVLGSEEIKTPLWGLMNCSFGK